MTLYKSRDLGEIFLEELTRITFKIISEVWAAPIELIKLSDTAGKGDDVTENKIVLNEK